MNRMSTILTLAPRVVPASYPLTHQILNLRMHQEAVNQVVKQQVIINLSEFPWVRNVGVAKLDPLPPDLS